MTINHRAEEILFNPFYEHEYELGSESIQIPSRRHQPLPTTIYVNVVAGAATPLEINRHPSTNPIREIIKLYRVHFSAQVVVGGSGRQV